MSMQRMLYSNYKRDEGEEGKRQKKGGIGRLDVINSREW